MSLDAQDIEQLAEALEAHRVQVAMKHKQAMRAHWPRRILIIVVALTAGVVINIIVEDTGLKECLQSAELALSTLMDSAFARVRDID